MRNIVNWKIFFILLTLSILSTLAIFPYILTVQKDLFESLPVSLPLIIIMQTLQSTILFSIAIFLGLILSSKVGFSLPILKKIIDKQVFKNDLIQTIRLALPLGIVVGLLITLGDIIFSRFGVVISIALVEVPIWQGFLAAFYGGIVEEILMRLFLMSLIVLVLAKAFRKPDKEASKSQFIVWFAILLASIIFGIGHLPITASLTALTPIVILRALVLNGIGGIVFGYLYWKRGLEAAIIAHFMADIVLHGVMPLFL